VFQESDEHFIVDGTWTSKKWEGSASCGRMWSGEGDQKTYFLAFLWMP